MTRPVAVTLTPLADGQIVVEVKDAVPTKGAEPLVTAAIAFDKSGRLKTYAATGTLLDDTRNRALQQQLAAHPAWTDQDKDVWLQSNGGQPTLGRTAPAAATLTADPVSTFLGQSVLADSSTFRWRGDVSPVKADGTPPKVRPGFAPAAPPSTGPPPLAIRPVWVVGVTTDPGSASSAHYRLEYEPFGGRLVGVVRQ
jgi:hypothetical protein